MDPYIERTVKSGRTFLSRWQGTHVLVRELTAYPRWLQLVLYRSTEAMKGSNLCLYVDPIWMMGYFSWSNAAVDVQGVRSDDTPAQGFTPREYIFEISDKSAGCVLLTSSLEIKENVSLL